MSLVKFWKISGIPCFHVSVVVDCRRHQPPETCIHRLHQEDWACSECTCRPAFTKPYKICINKRLSLMVPVTGCVSVSLPEYSAQNSLFSTSWLIASSWQCPKLERKSYFKRVTRARLCKSGAIWTIFKMSKLLWCSLLTRLWKDGQADILHLYQKRFIPSLTTGPT